MLYRYSAADRSGKITEGEFEARDLKEVLQFLSSRSLRPLSIKSSRDGIRLAAFFKRGISLKDKVFLTKYIALMLKVGTDLLSAIDILIADFDKPAVKEFLLEVRENLTRGLPFYEAFQRRPKSFSLVFINSVKAAEVSGKLEETFENLSVSLEKEASLRNKIRSALIYPIILTVISTFIIFFLSTFAIPRIAQSFLRSGINPPTFSRIVFGAGIFIGDNAVMLISLLVVLVGGGAIFFWKSAFGRSLLSAFLVSLPLIRKTYRDIAIQRLASVFSSLIKANLPITEVIDITAQVVGVEDFRLGLLRVSEGLRGGLTLGDAFRREAIFPRVLVNLIAISEKAGHLDEVMATLADFYQSNVEASVQSLVAFIEPLLLLIMGALVASIALAIIVPVYQLTSQF